MSRSNRTVVGAVLAATLAFGFGGCTSTVKPIDPGVAGERTELDRGYSTLASLLGDERQVHKILPLKSEGLEVKLLTQEIAAASALADDALKGLVALDPPVNLDQPTDLPMIEQAARDSIRMETTLDLLFSDDSFETRLLLSQGQALRYGQFIAVRLKQADPNTERQKWLDDLAKEYERLYARVVETLQPNAEPESESADSGNAAEETRAADRPMR
jgi:hypothetical protein